MTNPRLSRQIEFVLELDKLTRVLRRTTLLDGSRSENDAEHSWRLAVMAVLLAEYANESLDTLRVIRMVLIHDAVEIDAGDTFVYDEKASEGRVEREKKAADRVFSILPQDQAGELRALWEEFEARKTPEARFAAALDRVQPILHFREVDIWQYIKRHGVPYCELYNRNYRSLGCAPCTSPSTGSGPERSGRARDKEEIMARLREMGYF